MNVSESLNSDQLIAAIGRRVREVREAAGLTQHALAKRAKISRVTVSQLENGHREQVKPATIEKIARATDHPIGYFLYGEQAHAIQRSFAPQLGGVWLKLLLLPPSEQVKVGRLLEQILIWYEAEVVQQ
jgi:transcriptional regulator with XRE-family HTH domain